MLFVSVPNYSVRKFNKDYYAVALTNGNIGAGLVHKDDFDEFVRANNGKDYRKTAKKVAIGLATVGLATAAIIYRKPITETAKKVYEAVKNSDVVQKTSAFVKEKYAVVKEKASEIYADVSKKTKETVKRVKTTRPKVSKK